MKAPHVWRIKPDNHLILLVHQPRSHVRRQSQVTSQLGVPNRTMNINWADEEAIFYKSIFCAGWAVTPVHIGRGRGDFESSITPIPATSITPIPANWQVICTGNQKPT
jgi:hypothetical protein